MANYDDTNKGALFRNDKKESENHPDYKGSINVGGEEFWLSAWLNTSKAGAKYMSLSVSPKEQPRQAPAPSGYRKPSQDAAKAFAPKRGNQGSGFDDFDSDLPPF